MRRTVLVSITALAALLHLPVHAQMQAPRPDPLPLIQLATTIAPQIKDLCIARFPDLKAAIEQQWAAWPLKDVKVQILVNGREYVSPFIADIAAEFNAEPPEKLRPGCEGFGEMLASFIARVPQDVLRPFLPGPAKP